MISNSLCLSLFALLDCAPNFSSVWIIAFFPFYSISFSLSQLSKIINQLQKLIRISYPAKPDGRILRSIRHLATSVAIHSHAPFNFLHEKFHGKKNKKLSLLMDSYFLSSQKLNLENKTARFPRSDRRYVLQLT